MNIEVTDKKKISNTDILNFENLYLCRIPKEFTRFLYKYNGGRLASNIFKINENYDISINKFLTLSEMEGIIPHIENIGKCVFPFALVEGGNYLLINFENSSISYWDHEEPYKKYSLSDNIQAFLLKLESFDVNSVDLPEDQVESVWVDPEFLKSLRSKGPGGK
jgi:hypothetical protein